MNDSVRRLLRKILHVCNFVWLQSSVAAGEAPQEEVPELLSDNESEPYPEDDIPQEDEEEEEDDDEEDDDYEEDYKVGRLILPSHLYWVFPSLLWVIHSSVLWKQSPPSTQTQDKKDDDSEGTMPPYDPQTQELIDGKSDDKTWLVSQSVFSDE